MQTVRMPSGADGESDLVSHGGTEIEEAVT